jgi:Mg2+ and Co2+ transporter CorA
MQSDALVKRRMGRLTQRRARLLRFSKKAFPVVMKYVYDTRINKRKINKQDLIKALQDSDVSPSKINGLADRIFPALENFNNELTDIYRQVFDLQEETGWKFINEIEGSTKLDPETYIPITFDPMRIQDNLEEVIQAMTRARRQSIEKRDTIHRSLMYALGWLPSTFETKDPVSSLFRKDRDIDGQAIKNNRDLLSRVVETQLDSDSVNSLTLARSLTNPLDSVGANERLYGTLGRDWFVVKQEDNYLIVKMPNKLEELSVADRAKYKKAVEGDVTEYIPTILDILKRSKNEDIIQAEMVELLSFKLGKGVYGSGVKIGVNNTPILGLADPAKKGSGVWIQNITPEEVAIDDSLASFVQIDPTMSTLDFMNGRLFELHAQRELDRLLGSKGIRMYEFLREAEEIAIERIQQEGHSPKDTDMLVKSVRNGIQKLKEQYSMYSQHLTQIDDNYSSLAVHAGTLSQNMLTSAVSWGFGVLALTETILVKSGQGINNATHPTRIIKDAALLIRNVLGDLRYDKAADRIEVADTIFAFDLLNRNNSARYLSELDEGVELTTGLKEKIFGPAKGSVPDRVNSGVMGLVQRRVSNLAYFAREVGSLQQVTNANRMIATPKYTRMFVKLIKGDKIDELISVLETKDVRNKIRKLEEEAATDRSKQAELVKYVKGLAREVGGMDYQTVSALLQYGLLNKEAINALRLAFTESGLRVDGGRIDLMQLNNFVLDLRTNKRRVDGLDPDVLEDAIDSLTYMIEQLVITREITETQGLAQGTGIVSRHPLGRLLTSLFGWINAFHYNVFTNYGNRTSPKYLIGTLMVAGLANAVAMTFRQWIRGRDPEDILMEMEEDPLRFLALSVQGIPALGRFNSIIDGGVAGVQMMLGSTPQHLFSPFGVPGLEALPKAGTDISRGFNKTYDYISGDKNVSGADVAAALTKSAQLDGLINNSFLALPVRVFESADIIKEGNALREYLDTIQFAETPYQDLTKKRRTKSRIKNIDNIRKSSLREEMATIRENRENLKRSLKIDRTTPQEMKERVQRNFSIETGDFYRSPRKAQMTPEAPEALESLREPSRASQKLADILEEQDE